MQWCWNVGTPLHQPDLDTLYLYQAQTLNLLKQYRELKTDQPWTAFHTNEFVPQ